MLTVSFVACAHRDVKKEEVPLTANPAVEVDNLGKQVEEGKQAQVDVLAPGYFRQAERYYRKAKVDREKAKSSKVILDDVAWGLAYVKKSKDVADNTRGQIGPVVEARQAALNAEANQYLPKEMARIDGRFRRLASKYEPGNYAADPEDIDQLQRQYLDLEVGAVKKQKLGQAMSLLEKAKDRRAARYVPSILQQAETSLLSAERIIEADRNNQDRVQQAVEEASRQARRVYALNEVARSAEGKSPEEIAVALEKRQRELDEQDQALQSTQRELATATAQASELANERGVLEKRQELDRTLEQAQAEFSPEEAEVFRQGDRLIIRLKSIAFSTNRAEIPSQSMRTLEKVRKIVTELEPSHLVVEGHTDSTGDARTNMKLSLARAKSVKEFLTTQGPVQDNAVEVKGYGYQRPIATNKTRAGRAANRRVDLVVEQVNSSRQ